MCLLTFLPSGVAPDIEALGNGAEVNNDGHGFAIVTGEQLDEVMVHRGMHPEAVLDAFAAVRAQHPQGPALFHSRFATHGSAGLDNCHPFVVGGDARTVLAHNGVLPGIVQPGKGDPRSDTRIAAEDFIPAFGSLRSRRNRLALARWMRPDNKMVILTVDRRFTQRAYILNEDAGIWDGGIWYSNTSYRADVGLGRHVGWYDFAGHDPARGDDADWRLVLDRCGNCQAGIDFRYAECPWCGWCLDCGQVPDGCFCYAPADLDRISEGSRRR